MAKKKAAGACSRLKEAETLRRSLQQKNLLRADLKIKKDKEFIYFPLKELPKDAASYRIVTTFFEQKETKPRSYKDIIKIPTRLRMELPTSYDIIGNILLIKIPKNLLPFQKEIGEALLAAHHQIRTVCNVDAVAGELRTRKITIIAGERKTQTIHKEYGLDFNVDVKTAYFSPRLAQERKRVSGLVKPNETIVDMFAGVAPFSIMIARYAQPRIVYAVDKNKAAVDLALQNVKQNHVLERVEVLHADAKEIERIIPVKADRIIMNLPFSAYAFFPSALRIAETTAIVHYYDIIREEDLQGRIDALEKIAAKQHRSVTDVHIRTIKSYAPGEFYIGIDITATRHADVA